MRTADQRLRQLARQRLESSEVIVDTCRAWYSRPVRLRIAAARYRDFVVLTDRRLMMYSAGWLTRRPRRRVLADRLTDLTIATPRRTTTLEITHPSHPPMRLEFSNGMVARRIAAALLQASKGVAPSPPSEVLQSDSRE